MCMQAMQGRPVEERWMQLLHCSNGVHGGRAAAGDFLKALAPACISTSKPFPSKPLKASTDVDWIPAAR